MAFLTGDSLELLFQTEPSLHDDRFKIDLLRELMVYLSENDIWPVVTAPETIGLFVAGVREAIEYLIGVIGDDQLPVFIRRVACRILAGVPDIAGWEESILARVQQRVAMVTNVYEAGDLVGLLSAHRLGGTADVARLLESAPFNEDHIFRDRVYQWIMSLGLTMEFWDYGVMGIPVWLRHNTPTTNIGSGSTLEAFLLSFRRREQLYPLFRGISDPDWVNKHWSEPKKEGFLSRLQRKCVVLYKEDSLTILPMISFLRGAGKNYLQRDPTVLEEFLAPTKCHSLLIHGLGEEVFRGNNWEFGRLATPEGFDFILCRNSRRGEF